MQAESVLEASPPEVIRFAALFSALLIRFGSDSFSKSLVCVGVLNSEVW